MRASCLWILVVCLAGFWVGCRTTTVRKAPKHSSAQVSKEKKTPPPKVAPAPKPSPIVKTPERRVGQVAMREAQKKLKNARRLFGRGDYAAAEALLKEAITIFPFVPEANLLLGKIFLIQGAANRDLAMMDNARLMFEMAKAMEPENREITTLLELFRARRPD